MNRPKIVIVLSVLYALVALGSLLSVLMGRPLLLGLLNALLAGVLAAGLWRLQNWARRLVILLLSIGLVVGVCMGVAVFIPMILQGRFASLVGLTMLLAVYIGIGVLIRLLLSAPVKQAFSRATGNQQQATSNT